MAQMNSEEYLYQATIAAGEVMKILAALPLPQQFTVVSFMTSLNRDVMRLPPLVQWAKCHAVEVED